jgi:hypothetical protein
VERERERREHRERRQRRDHAERDGHPRPRVATRCGDVGRASVLHRGVRVQARYHGTPRPVGQDLQTACSHYTSPGSRSEWEMRAGRETCGDGLAAVRGLGAPGSHGMSPAASPGRETAERYGGVHADLRHLCLYRSFLSIPCLGPPAQLTPATSPYRSVSSPKGRRKAPFSLAPAEGCAGDSSASAQRRSAPEGRSRVCEDSASE